MHTQNTNLATLAYGLLDLVIDSRRVRAKIYSNNSCLYFVLVLCMQGKDKKEFVFKRNLQICVILFFFGEGEDKKG